MTEDILTWFDKVFLRTRLKDTEVEPVPSLVDVPELLDKHFDSWTDEWMAMGEKHGRQQLLLGQTRARFGEDTAMTLTPMVETIESSRRLDEIGVWIVTCDSAETLLAKVSRLCQ